MTEENELPGYLLEAIRAARSKKGRDVKVLDLRQVTSFTDYFVVISGSSTRQIKAIVDVIRDKLRSEGVRITHIEGEAEAEWVLIDCSDFVVHIFSDEKRDVYDLERLWSDAAVVEVPEEAA